jgi:1-acyl-sn-glycerol-3-phosphate acyltransferase
VTRRHYRPFIKTVGATLKASAEVWGRDLLGRLTPADVDRIMGRWAAEIYQYGEGTLQTFGADAYEDARPTEDGAVGGRAYVVMSNHQSLLDVPSIVRTFPGRVRMVGKRELGRLPVWGNAMKAAGVVFVDRRDRAQSIKALERAKAQLQSGTSIWIAPEGTRSLDGELLPLKKGGFHVAMDLGVPIAPVWIEGTRHAVSPDSFGVRVGQHITVHYGAPIATVDVAMDALMEQVRQALLELQRHAQRRA